MIMVRRLAVFGLGRIGALHLKNLRWNPRSEIIYCVDESVERMEYIKHHLKLKETLFLKPSQADIVFQDESLESERQDLFKKPRDLRKECFLSKSNFHKMEITKTCQV
nr:uncharacterized protein LOC107444112 isoform X1 [Parasteatoda tepidariorum]